MEQQEQKWYIVNVMAGQENKIASEIKSMLERGLFGKNTNIEVLVPNKPVFKVKKGQKIQESQKLFPGYVFINCLLNGEIQRLINSIPRVRGFLGGKNNPEPVANAKMQEIFSNCSEDLSVNKNVTFEVGETLTVTEGPFESFTGVVENFDIEKQKVRISVLIFGRATSVELDINQVEKVS